MLLLCRLWPLGVVPAAFAAFLVWNGGVVLGDRAAHAPVKHCMQPLYFALFSAGVAAPIILAPSVYVHDYIALPCISASEVWILSYTNTKFICFTGLLTAAEIGSERSAVGPMQSPSFPQQFYWLSVM